MKINKMESLYLLTSEVHLPNIEYLVAHAYANSLISILKIENNMVAFEEE